MLTALEKVFDTYNSYLSLKSEKRLISKLEAKQLMRAYDGTFRRTIEGLMLLFSRSYFYRGGSRGVDWVASHPPLWGHLSLKLRKGTELSLRRLCLRLFNYCFVRSATPFPKSSIRHCSNSFE